MHACFRGLKHKFRIWIKIFRQTGDVKKIRRILLLTKCAPLVSPVKIGKTVKVLSKVFSSLSISFAAAKLEKSEQKSHPVCKIKHKWSDDKS